MFSHPNIVPVFEYGRFGPLSFIAYASIPGLNLAQWLNENGKSLSCRDAAETVATLAEAIAHAHQRGVIHRDIKPSNILLDSSPDKSQLPLAQRVLITDFGLAQLAENDGQSLTHEGTVVGTPVYMSPEQASGGSITELADIYSLGVILYELLTHQVPFRKSTTIATLQAVQSENPVPVRRLNPDVPKDLAAICEKCIEKVPSNRYKSAYQLAEDLHRWLRGQTVEARPVSSFQKMRSWANRNPVTAAALTFAFLSLTTGLAVSVWQRNEAVKNLELAEMETRRANENLSTAESMITDIAALESKLRHLPELADVRRAVVVRAAELQMGILEREQGMSAKIRHDSALALRELSPLLINLGEFDRAIENITLVLNLLEGLETDLPEDVTRNDLYSTRIGQRLNMVGVMQQQGRFDEAVAFLQENEVEPIPDEMPSWRAAGIQAENLRGQSNLHKAMGNRNESAAAIKKGLKHIAKADWPDTQQCQWTRALTASRLHLGLANDEMRLGQLLEAASDIQLAENYVPDMESIFPDSPFLKEHVAQVALVAGQLADENRDFESAIDKYIESRDRYLELIQSNSGFPNYIFGYLETSRFIAESCLRNNDIPKAQTAVDVANKTINSLPSEMQDLPMVGDFRQKIDLLLNKEQEAISDERSAIPSDQ